MGVIYYIYNVYPVGILLVPVVVRVIYGA